MSFNLLVHSDNTFLKSNIKIIDIISFALKNKMKSCALIDKNNMYGAYEFYEKCLANNLNPILGVEYEFNYNEQNIPLILIAINEKGYFNLVRITSLINKVGKTSLSFKDISLYTQDLALVIPSFASLIENNITNNNYSFLNEFLETIKANFKSVYLGIYRYKGANNKLIENIKEYFTHNSIKSIAMQYAIHKTKDDTIIINLLDSIKRNIPGNKEFLDNPFIAEAFMKDSVQLSIYYDKEELKNLDDFANSINLKINKIDFSLPDSEKSNDFNKLLTDKAKKSLENKKLLDNKHLERLDYELNIINKMGFAKYYLVVSDYVNYAKSHDIAVGPSRGSGGASLVAYLLNITSYDPLPYDLLFERFLNPSRSNYPDFDIDFQDIKRDEVIEYVKNKYGKNNVAHIATFSTYGVNSSIRDIAKLLKMSSNDVEYVLNSISKNNVSIKDEYKNNEKFRNIVDIHAKYKTLIAFAMQIEGLKRQVSTHASGIIISKNDLTSIVPTMEDRIDNLIIQYDYQTCEKLNLIKFDFLGVTDVTIIDYCLKEINKIYNLKYTIDNYPFDEKSTYDFISTGNTLGISQIESKGMVHVIKRIKPNCFNDIVDIISLYRPGPMDNIDTYIFNKNNPSKIDYIDNSIKDILLSTNGVIIYQEQIMQIVQKVANYTLGEADLFRRAISKKKEEVLKKERNKFIEGCIKNNIDELVAKKLFNYIYKFASYGFNKSHAVGYGIKLSIMASIKNKHPLIFYKAMLKVKKVTGIDKENLINEAKKLNVKFSLPSINKSFLSYEVVDDTIMVGLANILQVNENIAQRIIKEREKGLFTDYIDCFIRLAINDISMDIIKNLIYAGAFDCFLISRANLIGNIERIYNNALMFKGLDYQVNSYLDKYSYIKMPYLEEYTISKMDLVDKEKEVLGFNISISPLTKIKEKINKNYFPINSIKDEELKECLVRIIAIEYRKTKENKDYIIFKIEDESMTINARVYSEIELYKEYQINDIVEVLLKMKNNYFYINKMKKVTYK